MRITPSLCELEPRLMKHFFHDPLRLAISDTRYNMFMLKNFGYVRRKLLTTSLGLFPVFFLSNFFITSWRDVDFETFHTLRIVEGDKETSRAHLD